MTDGTTPPRKKRKTKAERERELLAQGQRDEKARKAAKQGEDMTSLGSLLPPAGKPKPTVLKRPGTETVTAKLARLRESVKLAKTEDLPELRMEAVRLMGSLAAGTSTRERAEKIVAAYDTRIGTKEEPKEEAPILAAVPDPKPEKAAPKKRALPENIEDVPGIGPLFTEEDGRKYGVAPWVAEYHGGSGATKCSRCDEAPVWSVLYQPVGKPVRALRAFCQTHMDEYTAKYGLKAAA